MCRARRYRALALYEANAWKVAIRTTLRTRPPTQGQPTRWPEGMVVVVVVGEEGRRRGGRRKRRGGGGGGGGGGGRREAKRHRHHVRCL